MSRTINRTAKNESLTKVLGSDNDTQENHLCDARKRTNKHIHNKVLTQMKPWKHKADPWVSQGKNFFDLSPSENNIGESLL